MKLNNLLKLKIGDNNLKKNIKRIICIMIIAILIVLLFVGIYMLSIKRIYPKKYSEYVEKYSIENGIDPLLVYSIIKVESNFDKSATSSSNAKGLMQLMYKTAKEISEQLDIEIVEDELYDSEKNIMLGTKYYANLLKQYNNNELLALTAYNAGIGNVNEWISNGVLNVDGSNIENVPFKETNMYVRKIESSYKVYKKIYNSEQ